MNPSLNTDQCQTDPNLSLDTSPKPVNILESPRNDNRHVWDSINLRRRFWRDEVLKTMKMSPHDLLPLLVRAITTDWGFYMKKCSTHLW
ncbi:hypothetical protein ACFX2K_016684 [Malus domestica]